MTININFQTREIVYDNPAALKHIHNILKERLAHMEWKFTLNRTYERINP